MHIDRTPPSFGMHVYALWFPVRFLKQRDALICVSGTGGKLTPSFRVCSALFLATQTEKSLHIAHGQGLQLARDGPAAATAPPAERRGRVVANFLANFWQNVARFRLYRHRSLQANTPFAAF